MKKILLLLSIVLLCIMQVYAAELNFKKFVKQGNQQQSQLLNSIRASHSGSLKALFKDVQFAPPFTSEEEYNKSRSRESVLLEEHKSLVPIKPCVKRLVTGLIRSKI